jgi:hypothetical protein
MNAKISIDDTSCRNRILHLTRDLPDTERSPAADALAQTENEEAFQETLLRICREQGAVDTSAVRIPYKPGLLGRIMRPIRGLLWKLLRHQHDEMTARHNAVYSLHSSALQHEHDLNKKRQEALERRMAELEALLKKDSPHPP